MDNNFHGRIEPDSDILTGRLSAMGDMSGKLSPKKEQITGKLMLPKNYQQYTGEHEVIPKAHRSQLLRTANKLVTRNIIVYEVPYEETHNESGGSTVYIAKETETNG